MSQNTKEHYTLRKCFSVYETVVNVYIYKMNVNFFSDADLHI